MWWQRWRLRELQRRHCRDRSLQFFIGTAYNGQKASNKGQPVGAPETNIVMYNSTFVNGGVQIVTGQRAGGIDFEQGGEGAFFNNAFINCRVGYRVVNNPVPIPPSDLW